MSSEGDFGGRAANKSKLPDYVSSSTQEYRVGKFIGAGAFGDVHVCVRESDRKTLAVKAIQLDRLHLLAPDEKAARRLLLRETEILKSLKHPHIVRLYDVVENDDYMFLIMDFVEGGDLFPYITRDPGFRNEGVVKFVFVQLIDVFLYLHSQNVIHRDLKAENLLVVSCDETPPAGEHSQLPVYPIIKVSDFGLSKKVTSKFTAATTAFGTTQYKAPEVILAGKTGAPYDGRVDIWSLGVLLYVMIGRAYPFPEDMNNSRLSCEERIVQGLWDFSGMRRPVSENAKDLISKLLVNDPNKRISLEDALRHPWFADSVEAVSVYERWCSEGVSAEVMSDNSQHSVVSPLGVQVLPSANSAALPVSGDSATTESFTNTHAIIHRTRVPAGTPVAPLLPNIALAFNGDTATAEAIPLLELAKCQTEITRTLNGLNHLFRAQPRSVRFVTTFLRRARQLHFVSCQTISDFAVTSESVEDILDDTQAFVDARKPEAAIECLEEVRQHVVNMHTQSKQVQDEYRELAADVSRLLHQHSGNAAPSSSPPQLDSTQSPGGSTAGDAANALVLLGSSTDKAKLQALSENQKLALLELVGILGLNAPNSPSVTHVDEAVSPDRLSPEKGTIPSLGLSNEANADMKREFKLLATAALELQKVDSILERCRLFWSNVEHCVLRLNQFKDAATRLLEFARDSDSLYARYLERMSKHRQFWKSFRETCSSYAQLSQIEYQRSIDQSHWLADIVD